MGDEDNIERITGKVKSIRKKGRPKSSQGRRLKDLVKVASQGGEMPHEFLLRVSRGQPIFTQEVKNGSEGYVYIDKIETPDLQTRIQAAKIAAPYYAPRMISHSLTGNLPESQGLFSAIAAALKEV